MKKQHKNNNVRPPVVTRPERLPLGDADVSWEKFEAFCREFVSVMHGGVRCRHYGKKGNRQRGIDLVCQLPTGEKYVYQCRQWKSFSKAKAEETIAQTTYKADRYFVLLSSEASADVQDVFIDNPAWDVFDVRDISMEVRKLSPLISRRLIEQHFGPAWVSDFLGRSSSTSLLRPKDKFEQLLNPARSYNHGWQLVGRDEELQSLQSFISDSQHAICLFIGGATFGKTKLLYELSKVLEAEHPYVSFLSETLVADEFAHLQYEPLIVIVDDAHGRKDLDSFFAIMRRRTSWTKVIVASRPGGVAKIRASLSYADFDGNEVLQLKPLKKLKFNDTCSLAAQSLSSDMAHLSDALARHTPDSPLVTLVAGKLLSVRQVTPQQLESDPDFQTTVLARFAETITGEGLSDWQRRLIQFISAMAPVGVNDGLFAKTCASDLKVSPSEINQAIADLVQHGALSKRGRLIEITPHVVSEHILRNAAIRNGTSTGFVEEVLNLFGYRQELLRNLAELDWRLSESQKHQSVSLLTKIWSDLEDNLRNGTNLERCTLLSRLEDVALFQPAHVLSLVKWVIANPRYESDASPGGWISFSHQDVIRKLPPLLRCIAEDLECLPEACDLLWQLGKDKPFRQDRDHGCYVLRELSRYRPRTSTHKYSLLVQSVRRWLESNEALGHENSPIMILRNLLQKEETHVYERGPDFAWEKFKVSRQNTEQIRKECIQLLEDIAIRDDGNVAIDAIRELGAALGVPVGCYSDDLAIDKYLQWQPEHLLVLDSLEKIMHAGSRLIALEVEHTIRTHLPYIRAKKTSQRCRQILQDAGNDFLSKLTKAIITGLFEGVGTNWRREQKETLRSFQALCCDLVRELSPEEAINRLSDILSECLRKGRGVQAHYFLVVLAEMDWEFAWRMSEVLLESPLSALRPHICALLSPLRKLAPEKAECAFRKLLAGDGVSRRILSHGFASWDWLEKPTNAEMDIFRSLCSDTDADIKRLSASALVRMAMRNSPNVKDLTLNYLLQTEDPTIPPQVYSIFDGKHGFDPASLSDDELLSLVRKLESVDDLDQYSIRGFLQVASARVPSAVVDLLLARIQDSEKSESPIAKPIPFDGFDEPLESFAQHPQLGVLCQKIIEATRQVTHGAQYYGVLYREVSGNYGPIGRDQLLRAASSGCTKTFLTVCKLLRAADRSLLFSNHAFVDQIFSCATALSSDCLSTARASFVIIATSGVRERTLGQPAESDQELQRQSSAIQQFYSPASPTHQLYRDLSKEAARSISADHEWDEEHEFV